MKGEDTREWKGDVSREWKGERSDGVEENKDEGMEEELSKRGVESKVADERTERGRCKGVERGKRGRNREGDNQGM